MKKKFKLYPFAGCTVFGILIIKNSKGFLKYYWKDERGIMEADVDTQFESLNPILTKSILMQANAVCEMKNAILWSY